MKRILCFLCAAVLLCTACTSKTPAPVTVTESPTEAPEETPIALIPSVSESADTSSSSVKPAETETAGSLKPEQEVGEVTSIRRYVSSSDMFSEPYLPELVLNPDGTFVLTENLQFLGRTSTERIMLALSSSGMIRPLTVDSKSLNGLF